MSCKVPDCPVCYAIAAANVRCKAGFCKTKKDLRACTCCGAQICKRHYPSHLKRCEKKKGNNAS